MSLFRKGRARGRRTQGPAWRRWPFVPVKARCCLAKLGIAWVIPAGNRVDDSQLEIVDVLGNGRNPMSSYRPVSTHVPRTALNPLGKELCAEEGHWYFHLFGVFVGGLWLWRGRSQRRPSLARNGRRPSDFRTLLRVAVGMVVALTQCPWRG